MKAVTLADAVGRVDDDGSVVELDVPYRSLGELLAEASLADLERATARRRYAFAEAPLQPIVNGGTVWGVGLNYRSKQVATGRLAPEPPTLFVKTGTAVAPHGAPILLPPASAEVDYEREIAVIVERPLFDATPDEASGAVAAVGAANDVTARDVMRQSGNPCLAKSFPGFGQFGSIVSPPEALGGLASIDVRTTVGGVVRQTDRSDGMLVGIPELLALISRYTLLRPGDVVLTGTPAGTGDERGQYLTSGDVVEVVVGDLPPLRSAVEARRRKDVGQS